MVWNGKKLPVMTKNVEESQWTLSSGVNQGINSEQCCPPQKPKDFFVKRWGEAWPFSTSWNTFSAPRDTRILSAGFWQNTGYHDKICHFVIWRSMANVKFAEMTHKNCSKRWIALKLVWLMHEHLLMQKWCTEWSGATQEWCNSCILLRILLIVN